MLNPTCGRSILLDHLEHNLRSFLSVTAPPWQDQLRYPWTYSIRQARLTTLKQPNDCLPQSICRQIEMNWWALISGNNIDANKLSQYLATCYQAYSDHPCECDKNATRKNHVFPTVRRQHTIRGTVDQLRKSLGSIKGDLILALLHGSLASDDFIQGYSDIDVSLWVDKAICLDSEKLLNFRNRLIRCSPCVYAVDYVQHHEFFVASGFNLESRDGIVFPDVLMDEGISLFSEHRVESTTRNIHRQLLEQALETNLYRIESGLLRKRFNNWYQAKCLLSHIVITPTLYYQTKRLRVNKRQAIVRICREYPQETAVLQLITQLRNSWPGQGYDCPGKLYRRSLKLNPNLTRMLCGMRLPTPGYIKDALNNQFQGQTYRFIEFIREMLIK